MKQQLRQILIASLSSSNGGPLSERQEQFYVGSATAGFSTLTEPSVAGFLKRKGYDYTLSVFSAEAHLNPGEVKLELLGCKEDFG